MMVAVKAWMKAVNSVGCLAFYLVGLWAVQRVQLLAVRMVFC